LKISAYLDESQVTATTEHVVVAGFYGENTDWESFKDEWRDSLKRRAREHLHMKELRWTHRNAERRTKSLLAQLGPLPYKFKLKPIYGATKISHFADMLKSEIDKEVFSGYIVCLSSILAKLCVSLPSHATLRVICEEQKVYQELARKLFHLVAKWMSKKPENPWLDEFGTVQKASTCMTEPSDYLAFAIGKYLDEKDSKKDLWCRPVFNGIDPKKIVKVFHREQAREATRIVQDSSRRGRDVFESEEFEKWLKAQGKSEASLRDLSIRFRN
jgi:hypothetical protein